MKKILIILSIIGLMSAAGCSKAALDTNPTDRVSGNMVFASAENAMSAINGIYRMFYSSGWGSGWQHENGGIMAFRLAMDLVGEDHVMDNSGSGWFWYDYALGTWGDFTHNSGRQYNIWNFFYTLICNANYILDHEDKEMAGDPNLKSNVMAQAYAIRAFAYTWLIQCFQQNDPTMKGVPLYFEPTIAGSTGKGRGTVQEVYDQATADIDQAISLFKSANVAQMHISHINLPVAYGLKARLSLVKHDYAAALECAELAAAAKPIANFSDIRHLNDVKAPNVLWGLAMQTDQAMIRQNLYDHMDPNCGSTYSRARHLIGNWLYDQIPATDARKAWWTAPLPEGEWGTAGTAEGSKRSWCQTKFVFLDQKANLGDYILMRSEEMYLIAAEAACHLQQYAKAKQYLTALGEKRDSGYATRINGFTESNTYNQNTTAPPVTLMDEILLQRRIELWNEVPRVHDLLRLHLGYKRTWKGTNHTRTVANINTGPGAPAFILMIPQAEFEGNENMDSNVDQNPNPGD